MPGEQQGDLPTPTASVDLHASLPHAGRLDDAPPTEGEIRGTRFYWRGRWRSWKAKL